MPLSEYSILDFIINKYKNPQRMDPFIIKTTEIIKYFKVSRQFVTQMIRILVSKGKIVKTGITKNASYTISPNYIHDIILRKSGTKR